MLYNILLRIALTDCHKSESFEDNLLDEYITHVTNYPDRLGGRERRQYVFVWFDKAVSR